MFYDGLGKVNAAFRLWTIVVLSSTHLFVATNYHHRTHQHDNGSLMAFTMATLLTLPKEQSTEKDSTVEQSTAEESSAQRSILEAAPIEKEFVQVREQSHEAADLLQVSLLFSVGELDSPPTRIDSKAPQPNHLISISELRSTLLALWRGAVPEGH